MVSSSYGTGEGRLETSTSMIQFSKATHLVHRLSQFAATVRSPHLRPATGDIPKMSTWSRFDHPVCGVMVTASYDVVVGFLGDMCRFVDTNSGHLGVFLSCPSFCGVSEGFTNKQSLILHFSRSETMKRNVFSASKLS